MSVSGLCQVCESAQAVDRCNRCGTIVCGEHFDDRLSMCTSCAAEVSPAGSDRTDESPPDVDHYEF